MVTTYDSLPHMRLKARRTRATTAQLSAMRQLTKRKMKISL